MLTTYHEIFDTILLAIIVEEDRYEVIYYDWKGITSIHCIPIITST